jgi:hypothetical protein
MSGESKEAVMHRKSLWAAVALVLFVASLAAYAKQAQEDYLDVFTVQVKPEKRAEFDVIAKKMVSANHQNNGDSWVTTETVYGPMGRVNFISTRQTYADAEKASGTFYAAIQKAYGKAAVDRMLQDFNQCVVSSRAELRRRRWDLSSNAPADAAAVAKLVGESRWLRTTVVHVRPGQIAAFESLLKDIKAAREKAESSAPVLVSQAVAGQQGTVFYVTTLQESMGGFDSIPPIQKVLGDEGYEKFLKSSSETVSDAETVISRFVPDLSNAPAEIAAAAPDYWMPKAAGPVNAKSRTAKPPAVNASEKTKINGDKKPE